MKQSTKIIKAIEEVKAEKRKKKKPAEDLLGDIQLCDNPKVKGVMLISTDALEAAKKQVEFSHKIPLATQQQKGFNNPAPIQIAGNAVRQLTQSESIRLAIEQHIIKIKSIENALMYEYKGESWLWGSKVDQSTLTRAKNDLANLDRQRAVVDGDKSKLPYMSGAGNSLGDKITDHFEKDSGNLAFVEMSNGATGQRAKVHLTASGTINKQIKKKIMATKKKAAKKAAPKKKAAAKREGPTLKSIVDGLVAKGKDNAAIMEHLDKMKISYSESSVRWYASKARA